ncbi:MAG: hypothetical protein ACOYLX_00880 [Burkholderiaceae bacterium]
MGYQVFDDGSTLTTDDEGNVVGTTNAWDWDPSSYGRQFSASALNPQANTIGDIFRTGISRLADYGIARLQVQNAAPSTIAQPNARPVSQVGAGSNGAGLLSSPIVLIGIVALIVVALRD